MSVKKKLGITSFLIALITEKTMHSPKGEPLRAPDLSATKQKKVSDAVVDIMGRWAGIYKKKASNYGKSWLLIGPTLHLWFPDGIKLKGPRMYIMMGMLTRMLDKVIRFAQIELNGESDKVGEASAETLGDLGTYSFMAASVAEDKQKIGK